MSVRLAFYRAALSPLGDSRVTGTVEVFQPLGGLASDTVCFVGAGFGLESNILSIHSQPVPDNNLGLYSCTAENGCGAHVHVGDGTANACQDVSTQGGHWWNSEILQEDPFATTGYLYTDSEGKAKYADCVQTGYYLSSEEHSLNGRPFILHDANGSRVACGILEPVRRFRDPALVARTDRFAGTTVDGIVTAFADVSQAVDDAICVLGNGVELDLNIESFEVGGQDCTAANGCGAHVHAGDSCDSVDAQMGHYYNSTAVAVDPWLLTGYRRTSRVGTGFFADCVITGETDYEGKAFVLHSNDGSRVGCGILQSRQRSMARSSVDDLSYVELPDAEMMDLRETSSSPCHLRPQHALSLVLLLAVYVFA